MIKGVSGLDKTSVINFSQITRRLVRLARLVWFIGALTVSLAAMALTLLAWLKSDAKKTLAAGVLHVLSFNVVSAILCFVGFYKMKKAARDKFGQNA